MHDRELVDRLKFELANQAAVEEGGEAATAKDQLLGITGDGRATRERFQAADLAAATDGAGIGHDLDVADIAGSTLGSAMQDAIADDPGPDAGADLRDDHGLGGKVLVDDELQAERIHSRPAGCIACAEGVVAAEA